MLKTKTVQTKMVWAAGKRQRRETSLTSILTLLLILLLPVFATAQLPVPPSSQFDVTGFIQSATLGGPGSGSGAGAHAGGFIAVNGQLITVPSETIVILPANALTWQELFAFAPAPYTGVATGMALNDIPAPLTTYEAHVIGNRVLGGPGGADVFIAGLIYISQQALNSGSGHINCILYATGEIRVGGVTVIAPPAHACKSTIPLLPLPEMWHWAPAATAGDKRRMRGSRWTRTIPLSLPPLAFPCACHAWWPIRTLPATPTMRVVL